LSRASTQISDISQDIRNKTLLHFVEDAVEFSPFVKQAEPQNKTMQAVRWKDGLHRFLFCIYHKMGIHFMIYGVSKGHPFGTQPCLQGVVCYTWWHGWREDVYWHLVETHFWAAGKRKGFCERK